MPLSATDILADESITHVFSLLRVAGGLRQEALGHLESMLRELTTHAAQYSGLPAPRGAKYNALEKEANQIISAAYQVIARGQMGELEKLAQVEAKAVPAALNKAIGTSILSNKIPIPTLNAIVQGKILDGHPLSDHWAKQSANARRVFNGQVAQGLLLGESTGQIVQRIAGNGGVGGLGPVARRDLTALVRTSVMAVTNGVKLRMFENMETVKGIQWLSTLDTRTTLICIALDGKMWRLPDYKPVAPNNKRFPGATAHVNCRSTQIPITYTWSELAGKTLPEADNQTISDAIRAKMTENGAPESEIVGAIARARASVDGPVRAGMTYQEWADSQTRERLEQILGKGRADLYNSGHITMSDLTDQNNRPLTVAELRHAVETGTLPRETDGTGFIPYKSRTTINAAQIQEVAATAQKDALEKAARAERVANDSLAELANTNAQTHGGPYIDARAALKGAEGKTALEKQAILDTAAQQAAPDWLAAWEKGLAKPGNPDGDFSEARARAYDLYARGKPADLKTWQALQDGYAKDQATAVKAKVLEEATTRARDTLAAVQEAAKSGDARKLQGALLDAQSAAHDVHKKVADMAAGVDTSTATPTAAPRRTPAAAPAPGPAPTPAPAPKFTKTGRPTSVADLLNRVGTGAAGEMNTQQADQLIALLVQKKPVDVGSIIETMGIPATERTLSKEFVEKAVEDFTRMLPPSLVKQLPKLTINMETLDAGAAATYDFGGHVAINDFLVGEAGGIRSEVRQNLFHELTHWVHRELPENHPWVKAITQHFDERTAGEAISVLAKDQRGRALYKGKRDKFYDSYMGRFYFLPEEAGRRGLEFPTRLLELLADPVQLAEVWNTSPEAKEDLALALQMFFIE